MKEEKLYWLWKSRHRNMWHIVTVGTWKGRKTVCGAPIGHPTAAEMADDGGPLCVRCAAMHPFDPDQTEIAALMKRSEGPVPPGLWFTADAYRVKGTDRIGQPVKRIPAFAHTEDKLELLFGDGESEVFYRRDLEICVEAVDG